MDLLYNALLAVYLIVTLRSIDRFLMRLEYWLEEAHRP